MKKQSTASSVATGGILLALTVLLSIVEGYFAPLLQLPTGVKLGLANIVVMYCLFFTGVRSAFLLVILKSVFTLLVRGFTAGLLSASGGLLSILVMIFIGFITRDKASYWVISVMGAIFHNIGQLLMISLYFKSGFSLAYAPILIVSGIIMGSVTSITLKLIIPYFSRYNIKLKKSS